jgi:antibiotic biosynthesis monooxygenase (ABM) superfamily enzyme
MNQSTESSASVTVIGSHRVLPGCETAYLRWLDEVTEALQGFPGYLGTITNQPRDPADNEYVSIFRFDSYQNLLDWERSDERQLWRDRVAPLVEQQARLRLLSGLEFWFPNPGQGASEQPSQLKMSLVLIVVVFSMISLLFPITNWLLEPLHPGLRRFIAVAVQVFLMTYFIMPNITRWLRRWLFPKSSTP